MTGKTNTNNMRSMQASIQIQILEGEEDMTWDEYFHGIAVAASRNTKCYSRMIGAVIVRDKYIVSTGYNGPPTGVEHCKEQCRRRDMGYQSGEGLEWCPAAHAETNAIVMAARLGHHTEGCTIHLTCEIPCRECAKMIINAGIREVVVSHFANYELVGISGHMLLSEANVIVRLSKGV